MKFANVSTKRLEKEWRSTWKASSWVFLHTVDSESTYLGWWCSFLDYLVSKRRPSPIEGQESSLFDSDELANTVGASTFVPTMRCRDRGRGLATARESAASAFGEASCLASDGSHSCGIFVHGGNRIGNGDILHDFLAKMGFFF